MLLEMLKAKQQDQGLTDKAFANQLGVPRSTWTHARLGTKPLGRRIALAAAEAYPDLVPAAAIFLAPFVEPRTRRVTRATYRSSSRQKAKK